MSGSPSQTAGNDAETISSREPSEAPCDLVSMHKEISNVALVITTWSIEDTKYTKHLIGGVQDLGMECAIMLSCLEAAEKDDGAPEETTTTASSLAAKYKAIVNTYNELSEHVSAISDYAKRRRLTPDNSVG